MFIYNYIYIYIAYSCCVSTFSYILLHGTSPARTPSWKGAWYPISTKPFVSIYLSIHPSICLSIYLSIYLSLFIYLSIDRSIYLSIYLSRTYPSEQKVVATSPGDPIISGYGQDHFMAKTMVSGYVLGHKTIEYIGT